MASTTGSGLIQTLGVGSGLDIKTLVSQLVAAERAPVEARITRQATSVGTQISAMGALKGALSAFQSALGDLTKADSFQALGVVSADETVLKATASSAAAPGVLAVRVQQLAQAEQLKSSVFTGGAASVVGTGSLTIAVGSKSFSVQIDAGGNTLAGIRDAINSASDNAGVHASLAYGQTGAQLILSGQSGGADQHIRITSSGGDGGLSHLIWDGSTGSNWTVAKSAQDAIVSVAGVEHHDTSNVISNAIDGVTLNLVSAKPDSDVELTLSADTSTVSGNVKKFVDAYNTLRGVINKLSAYDPVSKTGGPMLGDSMLNGVENQIRRLTTDPVSGLKGQYSSLAAIGIATDSSGMLAINGTRLDAAMKSGGGVLAQLFGGGSGVAKRLDTELTRMLGSSGTLAARDKSLTAANQTINTQTDQLDQRMAMVQQRYFAQFTALDKLMSQLTSTSNYLTQQLAQVANISKG